MIFSKQIVHVGFLGRTASSPVPRVAMGLNVPMTRMDASVNPDGKESRATRPVHR